MSPGLIALVPAFPLLGTLLITLLNRRLNRIVAGTIASTMVGLSAAVSFTALFTLIGQHEPHALQTTLYNWITVGGVHVDIGFAADQLGVVAMSFVTGVAFLIHVYSIGYMDEPADAGSTWRFFAYLNLFVFSMLLLVMGDNFLVMFIGWEGVGLCSYLLIGFWFENKDFAAAGKKAFIVNRVGDFFFILGMFLLFWTLGDKATFNFAELREIVEAHPAIVGGVGGSVITAITLLFFGGATGKSAQLPLYVWLPDAMAGPTPVSALIHAATMVTAGVYMVARLNFLFAMAPITMGMVATIGALTAFFAATVAVSQYDIKKVLAYSTVSQLGYMFMGVGIGAYTAGMFHVVMHAFFKALLFMGAGAIIHALHHEQDMRWMGGLRKKMPITFWVFVAAWFAIIGVPGFAGFFSKDEILWLTFATPNSQIALFGAAFPLPKILWAIGAITAVLTAFYMSRMMFMTFWGEYRGPNPNGHHHGHHAEPHEVSPVMWAPLVVLALLSTFGGLFNLPHWFPVHSMTGKLHHFLEPVFETATHWGVNFEGAPESQEIPLMMITLVFVGASVWLAWWMYGKQGRAAKLVDHIPSAVVRGSRNKWYVDELYDYTFVNGIRYTSESYLWKFFDVRVIDGAVNGIGRLARGLGRAYGSIVQTGQVQGYAVGILIGGAGLIIFFIISAMGGV